MKTLFASAAAGLCLLAVPASAATLDLSNGTFDTANRSWFFNDVTTLGGNDVNLSVTTSPALVSFNDTRNQDSNANYLQANLSALAAGNSSVFTFAFLDDANGAVSLPDVEVGIFDLDFIGREVVRAFNPVSATTTVGTDLTVNASVGVIEVIGSATSNVDNPTDFTNLTAAQQNAGVTFDFGTVDSFQIEAAVLPGTGSTGRNYFFGNLTFTEPTTTVIAPVPVPPALALMLLGLGGIFGLRRFKRAA